MAGTSPREGLAKLRASGLAGDTTWGLVLEAATILTTLLSFTLLGRQLGTASYGDYASVYAISAPLGTLAASGVTLALMQHVVRDGEDHDETLRSCLSMTLIIGSLLAVIGVAIASKVVPTLPVVTIAAFMVLEFVTQPIGGTAITMVQSTVGFAPAARLRLLPMAARVVVLVTLAVLGHLTLQVLGVANLLVSAVLSLLLLRHVAKRLNLDPRPGPIRRRHLLTSATYSIGITGLSLQNDGDKAVLASYGYREETGLYAAAYRIVQLGLLPVNAVVSVSHQRFLKHEQGRTNQHLQRSLSYAGLTAAYGLVFMVLIALGASLLPVLLGDEFEESISMVRWLTPLVVLRGLAIFPLNGLMGLGKTVARTVLLLASAAFSMVLYIVLIPTMTWRGAVLGTVLGEAALAIAAWGMLITYQRRDNATSRSLADIVATDSESAADDRVALIADRGEGADGAPRG